MISPVECAVLDEPVSEVARRMRDGNIGFLPVCSWEGKVLGAVTDRDLAVRSLAEGASPGRPVRELMTPLVVSLSADDDVRAAGALMREHRTQRVVVVDEAGRALGVVSLADLARADASSAGAVLREVVGREVRDPNRPAEDASQRERAAEDASQRGRAAMLELLMLRGITDPAVLAALHDVPREAFVPRALRGRAFADAPLDIGDGMILPQPYAAALAAMALGVGKHDRVLEVDTAPGYVTAILAAIAGRVISIERDPERAGECARLLEALGIGNVEVVTGDPRRGLPQRAPYEGIVVSWPDDAVPETLLEQLAIGGRLVMPLVTSAGEVRMLRVFRDSETLFRRELLPEIRCFPEEEVTP